MNGERDILGMWAGDGGEGARFWLSVFSEIKNRGVDDVRIAVCDGLKGLPEAITTVWTRAIVQTCVVHLVRNTFRYAARKYWDAIAKELRPVYTAPTEAAAKERFVEFAAKWGDQYPAIIRLWENAWAEFVPFLEYDVEIRKSDLLHERDRVDQCPLSARGPCPRPLPERPGGNEMPLSGHPITGSDRGREGTMDNEVEARTQRVRNHL